MEPSEEHSETYFEKAFALLDFMDSAEREARLLGQEGTLRELAIDSYTLRYDILDFLDKTSQAYWLMIRKEKDLEKRIDLIRRQRILSQTAETQRKKLNEIIASTENLDPSLWNPTK